MRSCAHAIAGRATSASERSSRRLQVQRPRQAGVGAVGHRAQLQTGRARQVTFDAGDEELVGRGVVDPDGAAQLVRQRRLDDDVRDRARGERRSAAVDPELAQPRPPLAVAVGPRQRRPELAGGHAEAPRPVEAER